eukprot:tig00001128_g7187.t1
MVVETRGRTATRAASEAGPSRFPSAPPDPRQPEAPAATPVATAVGDAGSQLQTTSDLQPPVGIAPASGLASHSAQAEQQHPGGPAAPPASTAPLLQQTSHAAAAPPAPAGGGSAAAPSTPASGSAPHQPAPVLAPRMREASASRAQPAGPLAVLPGPGSPAPVVDLSQLGPMLTQQLAASVQQATASAVAAAVAPLARDLSVLTSAFDQQRTVLTQHQSLLEHLQRPAPTEQRQVTHLPLEAPAPLPAPGAPAGSALSHHVPAAPAAVPGAVFVPQSAPSRSFAHGAAADPPPASQTDVSQAVVQALVQALPAALAGAGIAFGGAGAAPPSTDGSARVSTLPARIFTGQAGERLVAAIRAGGPFDFRRLFLDPVFSPSATPSGLPSSATGAIAVSLDPVSGQLVLQAHSAASSPGSQREQLAFPDLLLCLQLLAFQISTDTVLPAEERCRRLEALARLQYEIIVLARTLPWERVFPWVQHHLAEALACTEDADGRYRALGHHSMGLLARSLPEAGLGLGGPLPFHAGSIVASAATVDAAARPAAGSRASRAGTAARPAAAAPAAALVLPPGVASAAPSGDARAASGSGRARSRAVQDAIDRGAVPHTEDPRYFGVSPAICWCFNQGICKNAVSDGVCFFGRHICAQCHSRDHTDCARRGATGAGAELSGGGGTHSGGSGAPIAAVPASASSGLGRGPPAAKSDRPPLGIFPPGVARPSTRCYTSVRCPGPSTPTGSTSAASNRERRVSTATAVAHAQDPRSIPAGSSFAASTPERPPSTSAAATAPARAPARIRKQPLPPPFDTTVPTYPTSAVGGATLPPGLAPTPVNLPNLLAALTDHPDPTLAARLSQGFTHGFPLLYRGPPYSAVHRPHPTALEHLDAVRADVAKERAAGRMAGPFPHPPFAPFVASPLGAVPKKRSNPPKWRRITDLSYPRFRGFSVNRGIDNAPLHYTSPSVADAIELIITLGRLTQLGKADVRDAFRLLPVRPEDYWLLGAALPSEDPTRPGEYDFYYDMALPFGGRSSPRTFEDLGQALDHVLRRAGVLFLRYVDDILVLGRPGTAECAQSMEALQAICSHLGIPLAAEKLEGPAFRLVFLGVELDTEAMEARLSAGRYEDLVSLLGRWEGKRHATRHDLHLISALRADHHRATLHPGFHADLRWWRFLLAERHGVRLLPTSARWADSRELRLETDASGVGFGAVFGDAWLFGAWADHPDIPASMPWRELMAIVIAATTWGPQWYRRRTLRGEREKVVEELTKMYDDFYERENAHLLLLGDWNSVPVPSSSRIRNGALAQSHKAERKWWHTMIDSWDLRDAGMSHAAKHDDGTLCGAREITHRTPHGSKGQGASVGAAAAPVPSDGVDESEDAEREAEEETPADLPKDALWHAARIDAVLVSESLDHVLLSAHTCPAWVDAPHDSDHYPAFADFDLKEAGMTAPSVSND